MLFDQNTISKIALEVAREGEKLLALKTNEKRVQYLAPKIAGIVDDAIDLRGVLGGIPGMIAEQFDGPLAEAIAAAVLEKYVFNAWPES